MASQKHPYISENTLDDLLKETYQRIIENGILTKPSKGHAYELSGMHLVLKDPRARLSRSLKRGIVFSVVGEWLWYLTGRNDLEFIEYYIGQYKKYAEQDGTIWGGYGPRLIDDSWQGQIHRIISRLKNNPESRKAVIQLFDRHDLDEHRADIPCTCTLQFLVRNGKVNLIVYMRSNDAYLGLPHDIFAFTMLQEMVAVAIEKKLGTYTHMVGSLHLYETNIRNAQAYIDEGFQLPEPMPRMPDGDPWEASDEVLQLEKKIRQRQTIDLTSISIHEYWKDIVRILIAFSLIRKQPDLTKEERRSKLEDLRQQTHSPVYLAYTERQLPKLTPSRQPEQTLFEPSSD